MQTIVLCAWYDGLGGVGAVLGGKVALDAGLLGQEDRVGQRERARRAALLLDAQRGGKGRAGGIWEG